jgi:hypothetical protein
MFEAVHPKLDRAGHRDRARHVAGDAEPEPMRRLQKCLPSNVTLS